MECRPFLNCLRTLHTRAEVYHRSNRCCPMRANLSKLSAWIASSAASQVSFQPQLRAGLWCFDIGQLFLEAVDSGQSASWHPREWEKAWDVSAQRQLRGHRYMHSCTTEYMKKINKWTIRVKKLSLRRVLTHKSFFSDISVFFCGDFQTRANSVWFSPSVSMGKRSQG